MQALERGVDELRTGLRQGGLQTTAAQQQQATAVLATVTRAVEALQRRAPSLSAAGWLAPAACRCSSVRQVEKQPGLEPGRAAQVAELAAELSAALGTARTQLQVLVGAAPVSLGAWALWRLPTPGAVRQDAAGFKSIAAAFLGRKGRLSDTKQHIAWLAEQAQQLRSQAGGKGCAPAAPGRLVRCPLRAPSTPRAAAVQAGRRR